jgi:hypothetical protein
MLVSPGFRRFGDWAADTLVVYTVNARSPGRLIFPGFQRPSMPWLADVSMVTPAIKLDYEEKQAVLMFARRYPLLGKARADEIAQIWAGKLQGDVRTQPESDNEEAGASAVLLGIAHTLGGAPV